MSEQDKLMAFGKYLVERREQFKQELFMYSINGRQPEAAIRVKAGHVEATSIILDAFTSLYRGEIGKFEEDYLNSVPKKKGEEEEEQDESAV